jgi:hypothetical protein
VYFGRYVPVIRRYMLHPSSLSRKESLGNGRYNNRDG